MVGSGIRKKPIPDLGSGGQKGTGSGSTALVFVQPSIDRYLYICVYVCFV